MKKQGVLKPEQKELSVEERAEALLAALKPTFVEAIIANNVRRGAKFNDIEANSCAVGDVVSRALMEASTLEFDRATEEEVSAARHQALEKADDELSSQFEAEDLRVVRQTQKRTLKTMRGPVRYGREQLYFPDLKVGIFPPRLPS